jgi:AraC-like DNA-binding protein
MRAVALNTSDLDEAVTVIGTHFYGNVVDVLSPSARRAAQLDVVSVGSAMVGDLSLGTDVRMRFGELGAYHVDVLLSGELLWRQGTTAPRLATANTAAVFQPFGDTVLERWSADCRMLAVKIDRVVLDDYLARLLDAPVTSAPRLGPVIDTSRGAGASWRRLIKMLTADASEPEGLVHHPVVGAQFQEAVISGLLMMTEHQYRDRLDNARQVFPAPRTVRRALDLILAYPERPWTITTLAQATGLSPRSLQHGFQRHVGMSPMAQLRETRLARVHADLMRADPHEVTVTEVAARWGFLHLGRFAGAYRARYGVPPSRTLRS